MMRTTTMAMALALAAVTGAGCDNSSNRLYETPGQPAFRDDERKTIRAEIAELAKGKDPADIEATAAYSHAVNTLTARGSKIEPQLIEALVGDNDWAVRMGVLEVLASVGTRACLEGVIGATKDPAALVALHADKLLEAMTGHRIIPAAGAPVADSAVPPVPARDPAVLDLDAEERIWAAWHAEHGKALHDAWSAWWKANRGTVTIK
jgi:hypothetical protein